MTAGAFAKSGGNFLFKLNPDGSTAYSTYFSDAQTQSNAVAVDNYGHAVIAGTTYGDLPVTPGAWQGKLVGTSPPGIDGGAEPAPAVNGFVAEFSPDGGSLVYSTYFGVENVTATALALESDGSPIVAGGGAVYQMCCAGAALVNTITLPGTVYALAVDSSNNVYAAGGTGSQFFSGTPGAFQTAPTTVPRYPGALGNTGSGDAFVAEFDSQFRPVSATLLGGEASDQARAVALAANGNVMRGRPDDLEIVPAARSGADFFRAFDLVSGCVDARPLQPAIFHLRRRHAQLRHHRGRADAGWRRHLRRNHRSVGVKSTFASRGTVRSAGAGCARYRRRAGRVANRFRQQRREPSRRRTLAGRDLPGQRCGIRQ